MATDKQIAHAARAYVRWNEDGGCGKMLATPLSPTDWRCGAKHDVTKGTWCLCATCASKHTRLYKELRTLVQEGD